MRNIIIAFLLLLCITGYSQRSKPVVYYYTATSERYFSDEEIDSLLYRSAADVFEYNNIPKTLFEKKYPQLKVSLVAASRKDIIQSFKWVESTGENTIKAAKGSEDFEKNKALYKEYFIKNINRAFDNNRSLRQYFSFNNSDRITFFNSIVRVGVDGKLTVQENISVYNGNGSSNNNVYGDEPGLSETGAINNEIKRGIVREFPLYYVNDKHLFQNTTFTVKQVLRNGVKEDYHTENEQNGIRLFTGSSSIFLPQGYYTYSITYETEHQLKSLKDFDELYWNVTGNGWSFRIDSAMCTIILPKGANTLSNKCYTGSQGSTNEDCHFSSTVIGDSTYTTFKTNRALPPYQGITVATSWNKGIVSQPGFFKLAGYYIWNNKAVFFLPFAALFSLIFCFIYWFKYGRDKKKGAVYPLFAPPEGFSPAGLGYIYRQKYDRQLTAATIVDAAVRNVIKIDVEREGWIIKNNVYEILKADKPKKKPVSNYEDFESDIEDLIGSSIKKGKYNEDLGDLNKSIQKHCEENYKNKDGKPTKNNKGFFALNTKYTALPIFMVIVAAGWGFFGGIFPIVQTKNFWQLAYFGGGLVLCIIILNIFSRLLPAYSTEGRALMDKIEGFRMFLSTADATRFNTMAPPKKDLELYEKFLPFAIALDCEIAWGKQFENIIDTAYLDPKTTSSFASSFSRDSHNMSSSFASSFSGAISSASSPPSSSSGGGSSFGGGSSGGGGGGGGGGGW